MKKLHIIALVVIACLMGYIISTSASYSTYETFETASSHSGKDFQVIGHLVKDDATKPLAYDPVKNANLFTFYMTDQKGTERQVMYKGPKPQDFERSEQVVLTGHMDGELFMASKILLKCPSKYNEGGIETVNYEMKEFEVGDN